MESWGVGGAVDEEVVVVEEDVVVDAGAYFEDDRPPPELVVAVAVVVFGKVLEMESEEKELVSEGDRLLIEAKRRSSCSRLRAQSFM